MPELQNVGADNTPSQAQPGVVIAPGATPVVSSDSPSPALAQPAQVALPQPPVTPAPQPVAPDYVAPQAPAPTAPEEYPQEEGISWTASEFIAHHKTSSWYVMLVVATLVIGAIIYVLTRAYISVAVVFFGAFAFGVMAARQPRELRYWLGEHELSIGDRRYDYQDFRSFSVIPEGATSSIVLMPLKRFAPLRTLYYHPEDQDHIIDVLSPRLPLEERSSDPVDHLMRRIRF